MDKSHPWERLPHKAAIQDIGRFCAGPLFFDEVRQGADGNHYGIVWQMGTRRYVKSMLNMLIFRIIY